MVLNHKRHNFSKEIKRSLREHVAGLCSNPSCRVLTTSSQIDGISLCNVGVAAHICAAAPGGPRYRATQTKDERVSYENGVWLCRTCSTLIDVDDKAFQECFLRSWKEQAKNYARDNLGKVFLPKDEVESKALKSTLDYISGTDQSSVITAPSKVMTFFDNQLNQLDKRFTIKTDVINGITKINITPISNDASFSLVMNSSDGKVFENSLNKMRETGEPVKLSNKSFKLSNSKLFEAIGQNLSEEGELVIKPASKQVVIDLYAKSSSLQNLLGSFKGKQTILKDAIKFEVLSFNNLISITALYNIRTTKMTCSFNINTSTWYGKSLHRLPFFNKILMGKDIFLDGGALTIGLEFEEGYEINALDIELGNDDLIFFGEFGRIIYIVDCYRRITNKYNLPDPIFNEFEIPIETYNAITYATGLIDGENIVLGFDVASFEFTTSKCEYEIMLETTKKGKTHELSIVHNKFLPNIFDVDLSFLSLKRVFKNMKIEADSVGDNIKLNISPSADSYSVTTLVNNNLGTC